MEFLFARRFCHFDFTVFGVEVWHVSKPLEWHPCTPRLLLTLESSQSRSPHRRLGKLVAMELSMPTRINLHTGSRVFTPFVSHSLHSFDLTLKGSNMKPPQWRPFQKEHATLGLKVDSASSKAGPMIIDIMAGAVAKFNELYPAQAGGLQDLKGRCLKPFKTFQQDAHQKTTVLWIWIFWFLDFWWKLVAAWLSGIFRKRHAIPLDTRGSSALRRHLFLWWCKRTCCNFGEIDALD